jgi:hypothetical protein
VQEGHSSLSKGIFCYKINRKTAHGFCVARCSHERTLCVCRSNRSRTFFLCIVILQFTALVCSGALCPPCAFIFVDRWLLMLQKWRYHVHRYCGMHRCDVDRSALSSSEVCNALNFTNTHTHTTPHHAILPWCLDMKAALLLPLLV